MNFIKIVIVVVVAHLIFFAGLKLHDIVGTSDGAPGASAGVDGIVNWSNQDDDSDKALVDSSKSVFDSRANELNGYNAGDPVVVSNAASNPEGRPRYAPTRPAGGAKASAPAVDTGILKPINDAQYDDKRYAPSNPIPETFDYKVKAGDSLWAISKRFGVTVADLQKTNPSLSGSTLGVGKVIKVPNKQGRTPATTTSSTVAVKKPITKIDASIYVVKKGDSISKIAARHGVTIAELRKKNRLRTDLIKIGQKLTIPKAKQRSELVDKQYKGLKVTMKAGDSLDKIAARYNVRVNTLIAYNNILDPRKLPIGKVIMIPESASPRPPVKTTPKPAPVTPRYVPQRVEPQSSPVVVKPVSTSTKVEPTETLQKLPSLDDDDLLLDEDLIEEPVVPIVE